MQLDIVTIFPDYFAPLGLSLPGKARATGLVDLRVHDLRAWTHDRHRSVDDTPYGGGPGMVMRPEPWGEAFDALAADQATVIVPSPSGIPFTQALARELATRPRLVIACGRYEGIDQRVLEEAAGRGELIEVSLGDYVLNGGEVAALAIVEAVVRLLPGFMGNPESLAEESHENGLLEYPVYTKPPTWRGLAVPAVLLSGNHAAIEGWRGEQARRRTASRRPDLLHASQVRDGWVIEGAQPADAPELLTLQLACWVSEAISSGDLSQPPLHEDLAVVRAALGGWDTYVVRVEGRLVGSVRGRLDGSEWEIDRLMVAPDLRGHGLGRALLAHVMAVAPPDASSYRLVAGGASPAHLRWYQRAGFSVRRVLEDESGPVVLWQPRR